MREESTTYLLGTGRLGLPNDTMLQFILSMACFSFSMVIDTFCFLVLSLHTAEGVETSCIFAWLTLQVHRASGPFITDKRIVVRASLPRAKSRTHREMQTAVARVKKSDNRLPVNIYNERFASLPW